MSCPELPRNVQMIHDLPNMDIRATVGFKEHFFGFIILNNEQAQNFTIANLTRNLISVTDFHSIMFLISGVSFSIFFARRGSFVYLVDSHSRDLQGKPVPDGKSVILKFPDLLNLCYYIIDIYGNIESEVRYELQFLKITSNANDREQRLFSNSRRAKRKRKHSSTIFSQNKRATVVNGKRKIVKSVNDCVQAFCQRVYEGPYYICVICNRCMYKKSVKIFNCSKYEEACLIMSQNTLSFNGNMYMCTTCHGKLKKNNTPCQAVVNKLHLHDIPPQLKCLNKLETVLISKRILFKKIAIMSKGQMPKVKGAICNIPVSIKDISQTLPRSASDVILVKLKKKMSFSGHVYFEPVCPDKVNNALLYLKSNNKFYEDVNINLENTPDELLNLP